MIFYENVFLAVGDFFFLIYVSIRELFKLNSHQTI
jgi:hypothetical protein